MRSACVPRFCSTRCTELERSEEIQCNALSGFPPLQSGEDFHVPGEAGGAAGEVLADGRIGLPGMFGEAC